MSKFGAVYEIRGDGGQLDGCVCIYELLEQRELELENLYGIDIYVYGPEDDEEYCIYTSAIYDIEEYGDTDGSTDKDNPAAGTVLFAAPALAAAAGVVVFRKRK